MKKKETAGQKFIEKRMHAFKEGEMHSRTKKGPVVTNPKQAIAISLSEAREKGMKVTPEKKSHSSKAIRTHHGVHGSKHKEK